MIELIPIADASAAGLFVGVAGGVSAVALLWQRRLPAGTAVGALLATATVAVAALEPGLAPAALRGFPILLLAIGALVLARTVFRAAPDTAAACAFGAAIAYVWALADALARCSAGRWQEPLVAAVAISALLLLLVLGDGRLRRIGACAGLALAGTFARSTFKIDASWLVLGAGAWSLFGLLALLLLHWRRRAAWPPTADPGVAPFSPLAAAALLAGVVVALGAALLAGTWAAAIGLLCAALAAFGVAHVLGWAAARELGAISLLGSLGVALPMALFATDTFSALGLAIGAAYYLWLAKFWGQQLLDERAWTTTGRMIPVVRDYGILSVGGVLAALLAAPPDTWHVWRLMMFVALSLLTLRSQHPIAAHCGLLFAIATAWPAHALLELAGIAVPLGLVLCAPLSLLSLAGLAIPHVRAAAFGLSLGVGPLLAAGGIATLGIAHAGALAAACLALGGAAAALVRIDASHPKLPQTQPAPML